MLDVDISPGSLHAVESLKSGFRHRLGPAATAAVEAEARAIAHVLLENVTHEFEAGTDKEGRSHNKTGATLASFHVEAAPVGASIVGERGAAFVESGFAPHRIEAGAGGVLAFTTAGGEHVFARSVESPGYRGDPYVERAVKDTDLENFEARIVERMAGVLTGRLLP